MIKLNDLQNKYNLKIVKSKIVNNEVDAIKVSRKIGLPVALKIESPDILHKSDIGGVKLNLDSEPAVLKAFRDIEKSVKLKKPEALISGISVQEMLIGGLELIIGFKKDKIYGPTFMIGMGGIFTEFFKDTVFRLLPVEKIDIIEMLESLKFSDVLLGGFRNIPAVSKEILVNTINKVAQMALDLSKEVDSFDINPITFWEDDYRVIDFKYVKSNIDNKEYEQPIKIDNLDNFFNAKAIALIGATSKKDKIGYIIFDNLINHGYAGTVYPINPKYEEIEGVKSYPSILDVPHKIDLVVITVPIKLVPTILEQCREKGIFNVIIISAGGKEIGEVKTEEKIKNIASKYGIRIIGCNCLGVFVSHNGIDTLFQPYDHMSRPKNGSIAFISQSGTVGISALELLDSYGVSKFVSYGNRIDVDEGDLLSYLKDDIKTKVISIYIEGLEKGLKFFKAAKNTSFKKPIVVYKAGRYPQSLEAALSHTGFLTGTHNLLKGVMDQAKIIQVDSFESLIASAKTLSVYKRVNGNNTLIITNGAGIAIQAIDRIIQKNKLKLGELTNKSVIKLKNSLPNHVIIGNPIDLTGTATDQQYEMVLKTAIEDDYIDILMVWFVFQCKPISKRIASILNKYSKIKPIVCGTIGLQHTRSMVKLIEKRKVPIFYSVEEWVSAAEALYNNHSTDKQYL